MSPSVKKPAQINIFIKSFKMSLFIALMGTFVTGRSSFVNLLEAQVHSDKFLLIK